MDRLSLKAAAEVLGISEDGVRKRVKRGSIPHDRDETGKLYVYLDASATKADTSADTSADAPGAGAGHQIGDRDELIEELRDRVRALEEANRETRRLLAGALERIPAIEAPGDEPQGAETARETAEGAEGPRARPRASDDRAAALVASHLRGLTPAGGAFTSPASRQRASREPDKT